MLVCVYIFYFNILPLIEVSTSFQLGTSTFKTPPLPELIFRTKFTSQIINASFLLLPVLVLLFLTCLPNELLLLKIHKKLFFHLHLHLYYSLYRKITKSMYFSVLVDRIFMKKWIDSVLGNQINTVKAIFK